jgi:hypothetical protein
MASRAGPGAAVEAVKVVGGRIVTDGHKPDGLADLDRIGSESGRQ